MIFFYEFICIYIYFFGYLRITFNLLIFIFMLKPLIFIHFIDFLQERGLLVSYAENLFRSEECTSRFLETLFFTCRPNVWISGAFDWRRSTSIDWRSVNNLWLTRFNSLENNKPSK